MYTRTHAHTHTNTHIHTPFFHVLTADLQKPFREGGSCPLAGRLWGVCREKWGLRGTVLAGGERREKGLGKKEKKGGGREQEVERRKREVEMGHGGARTQMTPLPISSKYVCYYWGLNLLPPLWEILFTLYIQTRS